MEQELRAFIFFAAADWEHEVVVIIASDQAEAWRLLLEGMNQLVMDFEEFKLFQEKPIERGILDSNHYIE